jgi:phosphocarrier protein
MDLEHAQHETRELILNGRQGLHLRAAGLFSQTVMGFAADVQVEANGTLTSGRSILGLLTLGVANGARLHLTASGPQAREALDALQCLICNDFGVSEGKPHGATRTARAGGGCPTGQHEASRPEPPRLAYGATAQWKST